MSIFFGILFIVLALVAVFVPLPLEFARLRKAGSIVLALAGVGIALSGGLRYNDAGYCVHIRTILGAESVKCDLGWYVSGWGQTTEWPHYITVSHTTEATEGSVSDLAPYLVRLADNWTGNVLETTRFGIPHDETQFLKMARDFRSPERLVVTTLRPAVTSSLDSVANLYTMEDYWSGGKRDEFKTEFENAVKKGRPAIDRSDVVDQAEISENIPSPSDSPVVEDTSNSGGKGTVRVITRKRLDANGMEIRIPHEYLDYGIIVSSAIVEKLDPDDKFEAQIVARKEAASRRIIAKEQRLEQEEQRLLTITKSERDIAERQGQARVKQIEQTTNAETAKRLALTAAEQRREEAKIAQQTAIIASEQRREQAKVEQQTAAIALEQAKIDAEAKRVTADADAYQRQELLEADNALKMKLDAEIAIQTVWADAYAKRNVPQIVMGGADGIPVGADSEVTSLLNLLTADTAKRLAYDRQITTDKAPPTPSN